ncbi:hypothetical protein [Mycobacterium sp. C31M]
MDTELTEASTTIAVSTAWYHSCAPMISMATTTHVGLVRLIRVGRNEQFGRAIDQISGMFALDAENDLYGVTAATFGAIHHVIGMRDQFVDLRCTEWVILLNHRQADTGRHLRRRSGCNRRSHPLTDHRGDICRHRVDDDASPVKGSTSESTALVWTSQ